MIWSSIAVDHVAAYHLNATTSLTMDEGRAVPPSELAGTDGTGPLPPEVAAVLRFTTIGAGSYVPARSGTSRPASRRKGRWYLPPTTARQVDTDGQLKAAIATQMTTDWGSFLNDIQGMHVGPSGGLFPAIGVLSRVAGEFHQMESISVPRKLAVQRRRQNKLTTTVSSPVSIAHG